MTDYSTIYHRWLWVKDIPSRIETLENYQLDEFLGLADRLMREVNSEKARALKINSWERVNAIKWDDEKDADAILVAVQAEKERRNPAVTAKKDAPRETPKVLALFYIYRQESNSYANFPHGQRIREIGRIAGEHGVNAKNLELAFNKYNGSKKRLAEVTIPDLERAIELLNDYPDAQKIAQDELRTLVARKGL